MLKDKNIVKEFREKQRERGFTEQETQYGKHIVRRTSSNPYSRIFK